MGPAAGAPPPGARKRGPAGSAPPIDAEPIPVPEVVEGNGGESDWNLWEDSVLSSDSQLLDDAHHKTQPLSRDELNGYAKARRSEGR
jgi:hypothetical protein